MAQFFVLLPRQLITDGQLDRQMHRETESPPAQADGIMPLLLIHAGKDKKN